MRVLRHRLPVSLRCPDVTEQGKSDKPARRLRDRDEIRAAGMAHAKTFTKPLTDRQVDICVAILAPLFQKRNSA